MTYLELVNSVLVRLRENQVSTVSQSDYSTLIGEFVNDAKEEVERAAMWNALKNTYTVTTTAGTSLYTITDLGQTFTVLAVYNETNYYRLCQIDPITLRQRQIFSAQSGNVTEYCFKGVDTNGNTKVDFWPTPEGVETITFDVFRPQDKLSSDSTVLLVPYKPVILGALWRAVRERGEDGGNISTDAEREYRAALSDAIAMDSGHFDNQTDWVVI